MAEPSTTPVSSASTDDAASEPCRYANGSEVIAELRARVLQYRHEALFVAAHHDSNEWHHSANNFRGMAQAFGVVLHDLDELSGSDQTQHEGTKPSSEPWA